jgi:integrase
MYFDARAAKLLAPGQHMVIEGCQGLRLVAAESRKTWVYRYKLAGLMKQVRLGHWPAMSVQAAAAKWQDLRDGRDAGADPKATIKAARGPVVKPSGPTVRKVVESYAAHAETLRRPAGALAMRRALDRLLTEEPSFAKTPAADLTRADAYRVLDARRDVPTATAKLRGLLASAWDLAHDNGTLPETAANWWRDVLRGKLKSKGKIIAGVHVGRARRVLRLDEVAALLDWLPNMHQHGQDVTTLYLWTCARGSEICGMRPEHITQEGDQWWWTVPASATKNAGKDGALDLRVPLFGRALETCKRLLHVAGDGLLFGGYSQHDFSTYIYDLQPHSVKSRARPGRQVLPVAGWTPHDLRRTGRTLLAGLGCPNEIGEAILGHMPPGIVATYNRHSYDAERVLWLGRLSEMLGGVHAASVKDSQSL